MGPFWMKPRDPLANLDQNKLAEIVLASAMTAATKPGEKAETTPARNRSCPIPTPSSLDGTKASADLYCGNLGTRATADELCSLLSNVGEVECCQVVVTQDAARGAGSRVRSRGFGFARFARLEDAAAAIVEAQAGRLLICGDRPLRVQWVDKLRPVWEDSSTARSGFVTSRQVDAHSSRGSPIAAAVKIQAIARGYLDRETAPLAAVANAVMQAVLCSPVKQRLRVDEERPPLVRRGQKLVLPKQRPEADFAPSGGFNFGSA